MPKDEDKDKIKREMVTDKKPEVKKSRFRGVTGGLEEERIIKPAFLDRGRYQQGFVPWVFDYENRVVRLIPSDIPYAVEIPAIAEPETLLTGFIWNDTTQNALQTFVSGVKQTIPGVLFTQTADSTVENTTTEGTIVGTGVGTTTLPADYFVIGKSFRIKVMGHIASTGTPTLQLKVKLGAVEVIDTGAVALGAITGTRLFILEAFITCRTIGATGTVQGQGNFVYYSASGQVEGIDDANTGTSTVDTTGSLAIDVTADWGTANAANIITSTNLVIEALN